MLPASLHARSITQIEDGPKVIEPVEGAWIATIRVPRELNGAQACPFGALDVLFFIVDEDAPACLAAERRDGIGIGSGRRFRCPKLGRCERNVDPCRKTETLQHAASIVRCSERRGR